MSYDGRLKLIKVSTSRSTSSINPKPYSDVLDISLSFMTSMGSASHSRPPIRALLIDLSGNLHIGSTPTPRAVDALKRLRYARPAIPFRFCSNTSKESTDDVIKRLKKIGFEVNEFGSNIERTGKEVWTSVGAVGQLLKARGLKRYVSDLTSRHDSQIRI